LHSPKK
jgi:hypothetical protein